MMFELLDTPASEQQLKRLGLWNNVSVAAGCKGKKRNSALFDTID